MGRRRLGKLFARAGAAVAFWGLTGLLLRSVPSAWLAATCQLLILPVVLLAWLSGSRAGAAHGAAAGLLSLAIAGGQLSNSPVLASLGTPAGALVATLLGAITGLLRERVQGYLQRRRESEERYVLAARGAYDGLWDWDLSTDRVYYSERWSEILGYHPGELSGRPEDWLDRVHPADTTQVRTHIQTHLDGHTPRYQSEHRVRRQDGTWTWVRTNGLCTRDAEGKPRRLTGWLTDISDRKRVEERLRHFAFHDALTGLPNRALFMDRVEHALARLVRKPEQRLAVFMLDLDRFKNVNDSLGHLAGDELLCQVARRLEGCMREGDTIARLGGDEFTILAEDVQGVEEAERLALLIQRSVAAPIRLDDQDVVNSTSIGLVLAGRESQDPVGLLRDADQAMYHAKRQGRGQHVVFDQSLHEETSQRLALEMALRYTLEANAISVVYQPIIELSHGRVVGFEAFSRWSHPSLGDVSPHEFVQLAEETGLVHQLGTQVLADVLDALQAWNDTRGDAPPFTMGINVSMSEVAREDWLPNTQTMLRKHGLDPSLLCIEVTEHALMQSTADGSELLARLRSSGLKVHLDDFGTGYSSLSYLHRFPLDALKIDGSFVGRLHEDVGAEEIVRAVVSLARDLNLRVIAEGVERQEQATRLRELGCDAAQGFLFGAPVPRKEIDAMLRSSLSPG